MPDVALRHRAEATPAADRPGRPDGARAALAARWHLAVVTGPDPGWCHPVRRDAQCIGRDPACDLALEDPRLSRRHLEVRERRGVVEARDLGSANGTRARVPGRRSARRRRPLGSRWRQLPEGSELTVGRSTLRVRARPGLDHRAALQASAAAPPGSADGDQAGQAPRPRPSATTLLLTASSLPLLLASGASGVRLLAFSLVPLVLVTALVIPAARGRRLTLRTPRGPAEDAGPDPAAVLLAACSTRAERGVSPSAATPGDSDALAQWSALVPGGHRVDPVADGPVALVGRPAATAASARWLACQLAVKQDRRALALLLDAAPGTDHLAWRWLERLPHAIPPGREQLADAAERRLVIRVGAAGGRPANPPAAGRGAGVVVLVRRLEDVPPWCRRVVQVPDDDGALVSAGWAEAVADALGRSEATGTALSTDVAIAPLLADPEVAWPDHDTGLGAVFAVGAAGPIEVDLARDGPHALVAGTTGSGKSELLLCWVLALASRYPPSALTVVAIDYKGGATFGPLAALPHVADVLTDLDAAGTARALAGLRAELGRRERILAAAAARDLDDYRRASRSGRNCGDQPALGRLLVVVDEFRTLADEHPELLAGLARLAAQGRSLGIHLVLATQRPAGALSADLRANLRVAICLRVLSAGDSLDVVGSAEAARLPPVPGRAILHGIGPRVAGEVIQAAWGSRAGVAGAVAQVSAAASAHGQPRALPLWAPPLPSRVRADRPPAGDTTTGLPVALLDRPERRALATWVWPTRSPLLIAGAPGTGRTTALRSLAAAALSRGWTTHLVHGPGEAHDPAAGDLGDHPAVGTIVNTGDPRRLVRLLDLIPDAPGPALLCIDDVDAVLAACERAGGISGTERIARVLRDAGDSLAVAVAGPLDVLGSRWATPARHRMVLGQLDGAQAALAGVPRTLLPASAGPGRGVLLGDGPPSALQAFLPGPHSALQHPSLEVHRAQRVNPLVTRGPALRPIPRAPSCAEVLALAARAGADAPGLRALPLGVGGDDAGVIWLDVEAGARVVVAGPPGSGRTSALAWLAERLPGLGRTVLRSPPGPGVPLAEEAALLVDDADLLDRDDAEAVAQHWRSRRGVVVAAVRTQTLTAGYAGLGALLRDARDVIVLAPLRGGPGHLAAGEVLPHADPADPRGPGRGVHVGPRGAVPIQVPLGSAGPATEAAGGPAAGSGRLGGVACRGLDGRGRQQAHEGHAREHDEGTTQDGSGAELGDSDHALEKLPGHGRATPPPLELPQGAACQAEQKCQDPGECRGRDARPDELRPAEDDLRGEEAPGGDQGQHLDVQDVQCDGQEPRSGSGGNVSG